jgi:hypothetical protein
MLCFVAALLVAVFAVTEASCLSYLYTDKMVQTQMPLETWEWSQLALTGTARVSSCHLQKVNTPGQQQKHCQPQPYLHAKPCMQG